MYRTKLVPLDGSMLAEGVLTYANELALRLGLGLILPHVCTPNQSESKFMCKAYIQGAAEIIKLNPPIVSAKPSSSGTEKDKPSEPLPTTSPSEGKYVGSKDSNNYHNPSCRYAKKYTTRESKFGLIQRKKHNQKDMFHVRCVNHRVALVRS